MSNFKYGSRIDRKIFGKISKLSHLSVEEQAKELKVSVEHLSEFLNSIRTPASLIKEADSNDSHEEYIESNMYINPEKFCELKDLHSRLTETLETFSSELKTDRDRDIFSLIRRVGTPTGGNVKNSLPEKEENYIDLARKHGVSRERIRQIAEALREKLKLKLQKNGIQSNIYNV
jgi:hypothetical protein